MTWILGVCFLLSYFATGYGYHLYKADLDRQYASSLFTAEPLLFAASIVIGLLLCFFLSACCKRGARAPLVTAGAVLFASILCIYLPLIPNLPPVFYTLSYLAQTEIHLIPLGGVALVLITVSAIRCKRPMAAPPEENK